MGAAPVVRLWLFVRGNAATSSVAISTLRRVCERAPSYQLRVVDVCQEPRLAADHRVLATPTVVRFEPGGERRLVGAISEARLSESLGVGASNDR